jgi:phospholipase C
MFRKVFLPIPLAVLLTLSACGSSDNQNPAAAAPTPTVQDAVATATPIKHLVVIFGENVSFDHYFATYPNAKNFSGDPTFTPLANTPAVNTLAANGISGATNPNALPGSPNLATAAVTINGVAVPALLTGTPAAPLTVADVTPFRLDRSQANTKSQNHSYTPEQLADHNGAMDAFPMFTAAGSTLAGSTGAFGSQGQVLGYFDGNTVTAYWNYAQHFAMSDNAWTDTFGPSSPGAIEVVSGQNNGLTLSANLFNPAITTSTNAIIDGNGDHTLVGDLDPTTDDCSIAAQVAGGGNTTNPTVMMKGKNIGDLLNAKRLTWGGFMGGFDLTITNPNGTKGCQRSTFSDILNANSADYVQHHAWFQYYATTSNPHHERPTSTALIGYPDPKDTTGTSPVHHQYDSNDFFTAVSANNFPSVSFLKAPAVSDGHPGNSDPIDEQAFVTKVVNFLMQQPDWKNTAVVIAYDDSDGWYDHQKPTLTSASNDNTTVISAGGASFTGADQYDSAGSCGMSVAARPVGVAGTPVNGRCGPGTRTPFIVISPYARANYVDHTPITQASVVKFIEDNWLGGQRIGQGSFDATAGDIRGMFDFTNGGTNPTLFLDQSQGTVLSAAPTN